MEINPEMQFNPPITHPWKFVEHVQAKRSSMNTALMTKGAPWRHIIRFALPVLLGSLLQQLYNTVDAIVVGNFSGEASLSAVGTTGSLTFLFLTIVLGFSAGNGVIVAQHYGANDLPKVRKNASTGRLFLMTLGVAFSGLGFAIARPAFSHFVGVPGAYLDLTVRYFRIYALGLIFQRGCFVLDMTVNSFLRSS